MTKIEAPEVAASLSCDFSGCPARPLYAFVKGTLDLVFCGHHSQLLLTQLTIQDFEQISIPEN